jgi:hypothetical protein
VFSMSAKSALSFNSPPICDHCGGLILELDQGCPALDDGVCSP